MEPKDFLLAELSSIEKWEKQQDNVWFWEKLGKIPFMILDKLTPKFIHQKINQLLDELVHYLNSGSKYLVNPKKTLKRFPQITEIEELKYLPLYEIEPVVDQLIGARKSLATAQGATTSFGGIFTLAIDIPAILSLSLNVLQEIAICYGYDPNDKSERLFIIKCLQFSASDIVGKQTILQELKDYDMKVQHENSMSQIKSWQEVFIVYRDNFGWKKLFQMIPIAGMLFGAHMNRKSIADIAEVGKMLYKKRRILERLQAINEGSAE